MKRALLVLVLSTQNLSAGLERYSQFVVRDPPSVESHRDGVRVTYLGTNGYQFQSGDHALLVDPYFSRINLSRIVVGARIQPDTNRIDDALKKLAPKADAILVTHGHFDHLLDVPVVMRKTDARLFASPTATELAKRAGASAASCDPVNPGAIRQIGPWNIRVLPATHDRLFGKVPFDRPLRGSGPPQHAGDWVCGEPLSFLIEIDGQRIFIDSGGTLAGLPPNEHVAAPDQVGQPHQQQMNDERTETNKRSSATQPIDSIGCRPGATRVDLAILGAALPDSRERFAAAIARLHSRCVLPSHQDNFFRPLSAGFQFGTLSDFPRLVREHKRGRFGGRLILLDYFQPWTLPRK